MTRLPRAASRTCLVVLAALLCESVAWARAATVLILGGSRFQTDEQRLVESLRIYTRDLGSRVVIAGEAPAGIENDTVDLVAAMAEQERADVVAWIGRRSDGSVAYYLLSVRGKDLRETDIPDQGGDRAAETVALKIRAILAREAVGPATDATRPGGAGKPDTGRDDQATAVPAGGRGAGSGAREDSGVAPGVRGRSSAQGDARSPGDTKRGSSGDVMKGPTAGTAVAVASAPSLSPARRASLGAAFSATFPVDGAWYSKGLTVTAEVRLGTRPLYAYVDGTFNARVALNGDGFTVDLRDIPLGAGVLWRWNMEPVSFSVGPRAALHIIDVESTSMQGGSGDARQLSASAGALARAEVTWRSRVRFEGGLLGDAMLPSRAFTVLHAPAIHTGVVQLVVFLGAALLFP